MFVLVIEMAFSAFYHLNRSEYALFPFQTHTHLYKPTKNDV